jgi:pyridoxamine 5'-phosphate oxidase
MSANGEHVLDIGDLDPDPIAQFDRWMSDAREAGIVLHEAIALATADASGAPAVRHVLLRGVSPRGFTFYTNRDSRKGRHLAVNPMAAFTVFWRELERQICVTGTAQESTPEESDAYFATRPREARIGAWASAQSQVIGSRSELIDKYERADSMYPGEVPRPPHWGGYLIVPDTIEFWQGRPHRLHDRLRYTRRDSGWLIERLSP